MWQRAEIERKWQNNFHHSHEIGAKWLQFQSCLNREVSLPQWQRSIHGHGGAVRISQPMPLGLNSWHFLFNAFKAPAFDMFNYTLE
jgi:hypothetical protein